jgi:hypothetical protein
MDQNIPQLIVGGADGAKLALGSIIEVRSGDAVVAD